MEIATDPARPTRAAPRLATKTKLIYGSGQTVEAITATVLPTFLFFYLTVVCGMSGFLAGMTMLVTLFIDAVADPLIGALSDNTRSRWGRRHIFLLGSVVPLAISLGLLFSIPASFGEIEAFIAVTVISTVLRLSFSAYTLPYQALGAELTQDYAERSNVAAYRLTFNALSTFIPVILGYSVFLTGPKGVLDRASYVPFGWACGAILLVVGLFCAIATLPIRHQLHVAPPIQLKLGRALWRDIVDILRNPTFLILFGVVLAFNIGQGVVLNLNIHANKYFWGLSDQGLKWLGITYPIGLVLGIPIGAWLSTKFEKRPIAATALILMCVVQATLPLLRIAGIIPPVEHSILAVMIPGQILLFCCYSTSLIAFSSMIADAADEHELKYGVRREALFFAGVAFAIKSAAGVGGLWAGVVLHLIGFPHDVEHQVVSPDTVIRLGLATGPVAAVVTLLCAVLVQRYRIDRAAHENILAQITARRSMLDQAA